MKCAAMTVCPPRLFYNNKLCSHDRWTAMATSLSSGNYFCYPTPADPLNI